MQLHSLRPDRARILVKSALSPSYFSDSTVRRSVRHRPPADGRTVRQPLPHQLKRALHLQRRFCILARWKRLISKTLIGVIENPGSARIAPFLRSPLRTVERTLSLHCARTEHRDVHNEERGCEDGCLVNLCWWAVEGLLHTLIATHLDRARSEEWSRSATGGRMPHRTAGRGHQNLAKSESLPERPGSRPSPICSKHRSLRTLLKDTALVRAPCQMRRGGCRLRWSPADAKGGILRQRRIGCAWRPGLSRNGSKHT